MADTIRKTGLILLYNDLRIHDNATLLKASVTCDELLIVYCKQPLFQPTMNRGQEFHSGNFEKMGKPRFNFLQQTLTDLDNSLKVLGNQLLCINSERNTKTSSFKLLKDLIQQYKVKHIFVSETADFDQCQGYRLLSEHLPKLNWYYGTTATLFDKLPTNELPKIYSQFRKKVEYTHNLLTADNDLLISPDISSLPPKPNLNKKWSEILSFTPYQQLESNNTSGENTVAVATPFIGGETHAMKHLDEYFLSNHPQTYKETRNALNINESWLETTRFSPWLANGSISVRVLLNRLRLYEKQQLANESTYWIWFELLWREYFHWYANHHGKRLFWLSGISGKKSRKCFYGERFERWKQGNTPYPIVNACMKQLNATGYMSNRGRQLVASCFIHELGLDWRYGASYFEQQLIDYDVASNWGNWQYLAGVGADPRGCRKFNLDKQTKQYDPDGAFIAKWHGNEGDMQMDMVDMVDWYV